MPEANRQYAYFSLTGKFDPAEVTQRSGIEPTKAWREGDPHPRTGHARRFSHWTLRSQLGQEVELEAQVADVLSQLGQNAEAFRALSAELGGTMQLVGYFCAGYPGVHFDKTVVDGLAEFGLELDMDFYGSPSEPREPHDV